MIHLILELYEILCYRFSWWCSLDNKSLCNLRQIKEFSTQEEVKLNWGFTCLDWKPRVPGRSLWPLTTRFYVVSDGDKLPRGCRCCLLTAWYMKPWSTDMASGLATTQEQPCEGCTKPEHEWWPVAGKMHFWLMEDWQELLEELQCQLKSKPRKLASIWRRERRSEKNICSYISS